MARFIVRAIFAAFGLALAAYATYVINATQFLLKLRAARLQEAARAGAQDTSRYSEVTP